MLRINKTIAARTERSLSLFRTVTSHVSEQLGPEQEKSKTTKKTKTPPISRKLQRQKGLQKFTKCSLCSRWRTICGQRGNYNGSSKNIVGTIKGPQHKEALGFGVQNYSGGTHSHIFLVRSIKDCIFCIFQSCVLGNKYIHI